MTISQVRFLSLSRVPDLKGKEPETIKAELTAKYDGRPEKIDLDLEGDSPMAILHFA